jgi:hypothetical protein
MCEQARFASRVTLHLTFDTSQAVVSFAQRFNTSAFQRFMTSVAVLHASNSSRWQAERPRVAEMSELAIFKMAEC